MIAAMQNTAEWTGFSLPDGFAVTFEWNWSEWMLSWSGEYAELGMAALAIGPLQVQFEWSIL